MSSFFQHIRLQHVRAVALAALMATAALAQAAPSVRAPLAPVNVGDTFSFTVYDTQIADAVDASLGAEVIDFSFSYAPGTLQYVGASSLLPDAFFTAPDLSLDPDPAGSFRASWVRLSDGTTPTDLFTVSFKLLSAPASTLDASLGLSQPSDGAYGSAGSYGPASAAVSSVPEPDGVFLGLAGLAIVGGLLARRSNKA